jgi:hypothetical protein
MARTHQTARKSTGGHLLLGQLAPCYPAAQVEAQLEEIQQEVEDYPVQLQPEMMEQGHQAVQPPEDIEENPEEVVFEDDEAEEQPQLYERFFWRLMQTGI